MITNKYFRQWAEDAREFCNQLSIKLSKCDRDVARSIINGMIAAIKDERKNQTAKVQKTVDACLNDLRKVRASIHPDKLKSKLIHDYDNNIGGYPSHMRF